MFTHMRRPNRLARFLGVRIHDDQGPERPELVFNLKNKVLRKGQTNKQKQLLAQWALIPYQPVLGISSGTITE